MNTPDEQRDCEQELQLRKRGEIYRLFNKIARKYDIANRLLSFGQDTYWRDELIKHIQILENSSDFYVLDIATGTGEVLKTYRKKYNKYGFVIGIDLAEQMLRTAQNKFKEEKTGYVLFSIMDALHLAIRAETINVVTIAFGIRNVSEIQTALKEIYRVLKPGGQLLILEFGLPQQGLWRYLYLFYLKNILPYIGGFWTHCPSAYQYLSKTICDFPSHDLFLKILNQEGFTKTQWLEFNKGAVLLYLAIKPEN